jgi:hypothetical protein
VQGRGGNAQGGLHRSPDWLAQSLSYYSCMHGYFFFLLKDYGRDYLSQLCAVQA